MSAKPKVIYPSEDFEATAFASWLDANGYTFSHLPLSTFTRSWAVKAKNTRNGVRAGVPDFCLLLKRKQIMFVELKKVRGGSVSPEQKKWLAELSACGVAAVVARGAEEAIQKVLAEEAK